MKKFLSISFSILVLLSGMHFTVATHYCRGKIASTKVSVSGEIASCGMNERLGSCTFPEKHMGSGCCKNKVAVFVVDSDYAPSFSVFRPCAQPLLPDFISPALLKIDSQTSLNLYITNVRPPGYSGASTVRLPDICVFRI